jgi:hypothetical protein
MISGKFTTLGLEETAFLPGFLLPTLGGAKMARL